MKKKQPISLKLFYLLILMVVVSCTNESTPTPRTAGGRISDREPTHTPTPNNTMTPVVNTSNILNTPTNTLLPTLTPSPTIPPTQTPIPSATPLPTATPIPELIVYIINEETGDYVFDASVFLSSEKQNRTLFSRVNSEGFAYFFNLDFTVDDYQLHITADNYEPLSMPMAFDVQQEVQEVMLVPGLYGTVTESVVYLQTGPGNNYPRHSVASRGDGFGIAGRNNAGTWLLVETNNTTAWIPASSLQLNGSLTGLRLVAAPPTPTPIATPTPARLILTYRSSTEVIGTFPLKAFDANEMYSRLRQWQTTLSNMSNILGATTNIETSAEACQIYTTAYNSLRNSGVFYNNVPLQWERATVLYQEGFIIGLDETRPAYFSCLNADIVEQFNHGLASQAINNALDQLVLAIEDTQSKLGN